MVGSRLGRTRRLPRRHCTERTTARSARQEPRWRARQLLRARLPLVFLAAVFLVPVFLAAAFLRGAAVLRRGVAGPFARRSASSSLARSMVISSTLSPLRRLALLSPSVTYGPNRPSRTTTGFFVAGSVPSSRNGAADAVRRPRVLGCASSARASSSETVNSCSSLSSDRDSVPRFTYAP